MATTPIASGSSTNSPTDTTKKPKDLKDLDINQFLQIMIAELTNQDPLNPMENNELVQQIGSIRNIAATDKLSSSLDLVQSGQSLTTASSLIGKNIKALTDENEEMSKKAKEQMAEIEKQEAKWQSRYNGIFNTKPAGTDECSNILTLLNDYHSSRMDEEERAKP